MLILLTHVHRKNFGIYGRLHLFQNIVTGLTKPLQYRQTLPEDKTICQYRNKLFILKFIIQFVFYASV